MNSEEVWFSHREKIFQIKEGRIEWTRKKKIWNWDRCTIALAKSPKKRLRVVVRSNANRNHTNMKINRPMTLRFMLGFDIDKVHEIHSECPNASKHHLDDTDIWTGPNDRWIFQLDEDYWIWDWKVDGTDVTSSNVYKIYQEISKYLSNSELASTSQIFDLKPRSVSDKMVLNHLNSADERIVPIIYQPAVDGLKNFVREVHCAQKYNDESRSEAEVTIIFNNEQLRNHYMVDAQYKLIRRLLYNRENDVETFKILIDKKNACNNCFIFENIYSYIDGVNHGLNEDDVHGDAPSEGKIVHPISYYFLDYQHPIVFINTSNHAMAEHDANPNLWKWEYVPGVMDSPVTLGRMTREEINAEFDQVGKKKIVEWNYPA
jgi:hypothetical protein